MTVMSSAGHQCPLLAGGSCSDWRSDQKPLSRWETEASLLETPVLEVLGEVLQNILEEVLEDVLVKVVGDSQCFHLPHISSFVPRLKTK